MQIRYFVKALFIWQFCLLATISLAVPPWQSLIPFRKAIEADEQKSYVLTEEQGPWLIMAASFAGEGAEEDARELVLELRKRYKWRSYTLKQHYDFSDSVIGIGINKHGGPKKMRHMRNGSFDEVAVLVGNFETMDSPKIQKILKEIKRVHPKCLDISNGEGTTQRFAGLRQFQRRLKGEQDKKGPMARSFITRNTLLPKEYFVPSGLDEFILKMNERVKYSLLDCPKKYTVRVATFGGSVVTDQQKILSIEKGGKMINKLEQAAKNAHDLTKALRAKGIEAYEFHDRHESVVTVGSFQTISTRQANGKVKINPLVQRVMKAYGAKQVSGINNSGGAYKPKILAGLRFDIQPVPVEVPRQSIANNYTIGSGLFN